MIFLCNKAVQFSSTCLRDADPTLTVLWYQNDAKHMRVNQRSVLKQNFSMFHQ